MADPKIPTAEAPKDSKFFLGSKTAVFNMALASAVEIFPQVGAWISTHPQTAVLICAGGNYILRHFSEGGLRYGSKPQV